MVQCMSVWCMYVSARNSVFLCEVQCMFVWYSVCLYGIVYVYVWYMYVCVCGICMSVCVVYLCLCVVQCIYVRITVYVCVWCGVVLCGI